ncbi:MAG TPA: response regulator [Vicinamibacterales bacterium]|nr:response regulator [Vicinamibacterales bacterium]
MPALPHDYNGMGTGMDSCPRVFVVDDDVSVLRAVGRLLRSSGFVVETFASPASFLERLPYDGVACLILDMRMPGLSGLDVQKEVAAHAPSMPTLFLSGASDVNSAATAMRKGAVDFLVKPIDAAQLVEAVSRALAAGAEALRRRREEEEYSRRFARLTKRERQVCDLVVQGKLNKQIAYELGTSEKTVKVHRARVMQKLEVDSVAALVWMVSRLRKDPPA